MIEQVSVSDSRRLLGPNRLMDRAGAVLDVEFAASQRDQLVAGWATSLRSMLAGLGWDPAEPHVLPCREGASLAFEAPVDVLLAATEVNEWAWAHAVAQAGGPADEPLAAALARIGQLIAAERKPALLALAAGARDHQVAFFADDDLVTIGMGSGSRTFPLGALPDANAIDWSGVHDVPLALVTGSNGKTTTVRLLAAMLRAEGLPPGWSSTDGVLIDGERVVEGDYAGPDGARLVLRDHRIDAAVLETARGGILRRGLAITHADVAVVTNVAADHFGEYGVHDLAGLAATKLVVAKAIGPAGRVVLNAEDPVLVEHARQLRAPLAWFGVDPGGAMLQAAVASGCGAATVIDGRFVLLRGRERVELLRADDAPVTLHGSAVHNVANALAASLGAWCLGCSPDAIRTALATFGQSNADNPGRANLYECRGVRILLDYAHNPHGMQALATVVRALPGGRRALVLGQAGNRNDESIRGLARSAWAIGIDRVVLKEMDAYRRGRAAGEIPALLADEFRRLGLPDDAIERADSEVAAVVRALDWAREGDLLVLTVHSSRREVLDLLTARGAREVRLAGTTV